MKRESNYTILYPKNNKKAKYSIYDSGINNYPHDIEDNFNHHIKMNDNNYENNINPLKGDTMSNGRLSDIKEFNETEVIIDELNNDKDIIEHDKSNQVVLSIFL